MKFEAGQMGYDAPNQERDRRRRRGRRGRR
jgi:hypothetical protein